MHAWIITSFPAPGALPKPLARCAEVQLSRHCAGTGLLLRQKLMAATDRLAGLEAELLNVQVDFPLFQRLALPVLSGRSKIPGIKMQDTP